MWVTMVGSMVLWMDEILHPFETMRNHSQLVFEGESNHSNISKVVRNGFRPPIVVTQRETGPRLRTCGSKPGTILWWVNLPPIVVYLSRDWDVLWGYDLDFDPWPYDQLGFASPRVAFACFRTHSPWCPFLTP